VSHHKIINNSIPANFFIKIIFEYLDKYFLVKEYADGGTLSSYLKENFNLLDWENKYELALQLSSAIKCLHENGIVHKDLHSNNILIHKNLIKLADFGLSRRRVVRQIPLNSYDDTIPYIGPEIFDITGENSESINSSGESEQLERLKRSDIYSIGVLFWELSSGSKPFADTKYDSFLANQIAHGLREKIVEGTPEVYSNLYSSK
jgi:serine/threonine protein kinase